MSNAHAILSAAAQLVATYVANNKLAPSEITDLIGSVHVALSQLGTEPKESEPAALVPAVSIKKSVTNDYIVCLEDGKQFKSLKRHLSNAFGMTPDEYRARWGLPRDYPMVAPGYSAQRSELAKSLGLGQLRKKAAEPVAKAPKKAAAKKAGRKPKVDA